jgi:hypothetical protein
MQVAREVVERTSGLARFLIADHVMLVVGLHHLVALIDGTAFEAKLVLNASGAVFGPVSVQHRDLRADGIAYADNYKGNAVAAMLGPNKIEIRFHRAFMDDLVVSWIRALARQPGLEPIARWNVTYQGRHLSIGIA